MALPHPAVPSAPPRVLPFVTSIHLRAPSVKSLYLKLNPLLEVIGRPRAPARQFLVKLSPDTVSKYMYKSLQVNTGL